MDVALSKVSLFIYTFQSSSSSLLMLLLLGWSLALPTAAHHSIKTQNEVKKVCRGTSFALAHNERTKERYDQYQLQYKDCTHVDGNLEIVFLESPASDDLDFLSSIQEVSGYVLIVGNHADFVPLTSLRVIRGDALFVHESRSYALYVALNYNPLRDGQGLKELRFNSLREIMSGSVFIFANNQLCLEDSIDWKDIMTGRNATLVYQARDDEKPSRTCGECDDSCEYKGRKHCWGAGPDMCQKIGSIECSPQCDGRCFGPLPNQCCHAECAGGCDGPSNKDCWSCRHFDDDGSCKIQCPPQYVYSHSEFKQVPNANAKFANGNVCVQKCPPHLIIDNGACVQDCGPGRRLGNSGMCVECEGACPKTCKVDLKDDFVHLGNIGLYRGCTIVQGRIKILDATFTGDPYNEIGPMPPEALAAFEDVQEVTEFIQIQADSASFRNLSFFKNLKIIHGRKLDRGRASLQISQTSLEWLGLLSLREIRNGDVFVANNTRLCYASQIDWKKFFANPLQSAMVLYNKDRQDCEKIGETCHVECGPGGCWGGDDDHCITCRSFQFGNRCVPSCSEEEGGLFLESPFTCGRCHPQCKGGCDGRGSERCTSCKNFRDGPYCVSKCPPFKFSDARGNCQLCSPDCDLQYGCTGPGNHVGPKGCSACKLHFPLDPTSAAATANTSGNLFTCISPRLGCPSGYFKSHSPFNASLISGHKRKKAATNFQICSRCHSQCLECFGAEPSSCTACLRFSQGGRCVDRCSDDHYADESSVCRKCEAACLECSGSASNCSTCRHYKLPSQDGHVSNFTCVEVCPDWLPYKVAKRNSRGDLESSCSNQHESFVSENKWTVFAIFPSSVLLLLGLAVTLLTKKRKSLKEQQNRLVHSVASFEPVAPSNIQPDMSTLTLIRQSELRIGKVIGAGAFGTVYQGLWLPANGKGNERVLVAIKVLMEEREEGGSKEILDEARIMASVDHPCCMKILCLCLSPCIMLVTDLMRLGCMLDFVRTRGHLLGSSTLVLWSFQIAQGMRFLQEKGIVHRDLAARNVLIQSLKQVKITDFGLAKLLNFDKGPLNTSKSQTRMPIKWLAYESIVSQTFTHQSDVWSFGVTLWELLTFGRRPYGSINAMDTIAFLEKGGRLQKPDICRTELYELLLKCWLTDPGKRPTFVELSERFERMNSNPEGYIGLPFRGRCDELLRHDEGYKSLSLNSFEGEKDSRLIRVPLYVNEKSKGTPYMNVVQDDCRVKYCNFTARIDDHREIRVEEESLKNSYCNNTFPFNDEPPSFSCFQFSVKNPAEVTKCRSNGQIYYDRYASRYTSQSESPVFAEDVSITDS